MRKRVTNLFVALFLVLSSAITFVVPSVSAAAYTCTWTGVAGPNMDNSANWTGCNDDSPQFGDEYTLVFPDTGSSITALNDLDGPVEIQDIIITSPDFVTFTGAPLRLVGSVNVTVAGGNVSMWGDLNLTGGSMQTFHVPTGRSIDIDGDITGTSGINKTGAGTMIVDSGSVTSYDGELVVNEGTFSAQLGRGFGDSGAGTVVNHGADLIIVIECNTAEDLTINEDFELVGNSSDTDPVTGRPKLSVWNQQCGGPQADITYGKGAWVDKSVTLSGNINLVGDITVASTAAKLRMIGSISGSYNITPFEGSNGQLEIDTDNNASLKPSGTYTPSALKRTLSDSSASTSIRIEGTAEITVNGTRGATDVVRGGKLKGNGTVGALNVSDAGQLAPGSSPGCLISGSLSLAGGGIYEAEIGGTTVCTGYDQMQVTGSVDVTSGILNTPLYDGFVPSVGQSYTIIDNDGADAVVGTFAGLAEGATFTEDGVTYSVTYIGGTGNDVVITVTAVEAVVAAAASSAGSTSVPGVPETGIRLIMANPLISLLITSAAAGALFYGSRRLKFVTNN